MKKILKVKSLLMVIALIIAVSAVLSGCSKSGNGDAGKKSVDFNTLSAKVVEKVDTSNMQEGDADKLKKFYGIESDKVESFKLYFPKSNIKADELLILKAKDEATAKELMTNVQKRIDNQKKGFQNYIPEEFSLVENRALKQQGSYILLSISKSSAKAESAFIEQLK